jgi:hypothetical protein
MAIGTWGQFERDLRGLVADSSCYCDVKNAGVVQNIAYAVEDFEFLTISQM